MADDLFKRLCKPLPTRADLKDAEAEHLRLRQLLKSGSLDVRTRAMLKLNDLSKLMFAATQRLNDHIRKNRLRVVR